MIVEVYDRQDQTLLIAPIDYVGSYVGWTRMLRLGWRWRAIRAEELPRPIEGPQGSE